MTSPIEPRTASLYHAHPAPAVEPRVAAAIVMAAMATYLLVASVVPRGLAMLAGQLALAAIPLGAVLVAREARPLAALGVRGARPRFLGAAIAVGATAWYLNMQLVALLPIPERQVQVLEELVERPSLACALVLFALLPAVCEEILFRGLLARALGQKRGLVAAAAIAAAVFAGYHFSVVQLLPTFTLGFVLSLIAIRADSILPTMLAHAINNALAIAISRGELPALTEWLVGHPGLALAGCATATGLGIAVAARHPS